MAVDLKPTREMSDAAERGLRLYEDGKGGAGLVRQTITDAHKMARGVALSEEKVRRMPGWFARHANNERPGWDKPGEETPGFVAWLLWGGDAGRDWSERKVTEMDKAKAPRSKRDNLPGSMDAAEALETETEAQELAEPLPAQLATLLADVLTLYLHAHGAHWNVKGGRFGTFAQFHELFGEIYEDVIGSVDPLAENLLKLGYDAPFRMSELVSLRELQDPAVVSDQPDALALMLLNSNAVVLDCLADAFDRATLDNEQGIANFLADRIDQHQKWAWQLRSSLDLQPQASPEQDAADVAEDATKPADEGMVLAGRSAKAASEERSHSPVKVQYRESGAGSNYRTIQGYASVWAPKMSEDLGGFREMIAPGAFRSALAGGSTVKLLYNHDSAAVLASTDNGTLELREDEVGLRVWARVDMEDPDVQRVASKLRSGIVDQMSFAFTVKDDWWDYTGGTPVRTVREVGDLFEVSVVAFPAYNDTKVAMLERARTAGRLPLGGATDVAPETVGGESHAKSVDPDIRAAYWRAQLNLSKQKAGS